MDINPSYNCLLGRPWIHMTGAIPFFIYIYIFLGVNPYTLYFITLTRCLNNEHEDNQETQSKFDFERMPCTDNNDFEGYMDDEALPLEMRRLID